MAFIVIPHHSAAPSDASPAGKSNLVLVLMDNFGYGVIGVYQTGVVTEVKEGDSWVFPRGWKGTAEVIKKVRKVYAMMVPHEAS